MHSLLVILGIAWVLLASSQATEETFPVDFRNTYWSQKMELSLEVSYLLKEKVEDLKKDLEMVSLKFILDGKPPHSVFSTKSTEFPKKPVYSISMCLSNYYEEAEGDLRGTQVAMKLFKPPTPILDGLVVIIDAQGFQVNPATLPKLVRTNSASSDSDE